MDDLTEGYLLRIRALQPDLAIESASLNRDGMANDVVVVNGKWVFRFPKTEAARGLLRYESELLRLVAQHVALPIPQLELAAEDVGRYRFVEGRPLYRHTLLRASEQEQAALAEQLALFLTQLHSIPLALVPEPPYAARAESRRARYLEMQRAAEEHLYPLLWADQRAWVEDLFAPLADRRLDLDGFTPAFVHRDLASYHLLFEPGPMHLSGVIDFGTAGAGDPAIDLACLLSAYGESFVRRLATAYTIDQTLLDRARFLAGALELEWALIGVRESDPSMLLVHLGRSRDMLPVGM
jgi:aminoglycoside 2''-phosphotransferase